MSEQVTPARSKLRTLDANTPIDAEEIAQIARKFADQGMFDEAIHLFEMACRQRPGSVEFTKELERVKERYSAANTRQNDAIRKEVVAERSRDEIDSSQYIGLAQYYIDRDQTAKAIEFLELAKLKTPSSYRPWDIMGHLYFSQGEWELAYEEVTQARTFNPFDRALAELEGRLRFELSKLPESLASFIDAFLLSTDQKGEVTEPTRRMINTLKRILNLDTKALNAVIRSRVEHLQLCTERLELKKEKLFRLDSSKDLKEITRKITRDVKKRENLIHTSGELRKLSVFQHMKDEQIFRLAKFVRIEKVAKGEFLFRENEGSMDFHVIREGSITVQKETPFGPQLLATIAPGDILGEMNFIDRTHRSTDACAVSDLSSFSFSFSALDQIMDEEKEMAVGLHWAFWRSLTEKVRDANDQLKMFFLEDARKSQGRKRSEPKKAEVQQQIRVKSEDKVDLFRERGLSAAEMKLLATFSSEERFREGSMIFREGDSGDKLFIVLDGRVRISKFIPGVGEEALAVLDRGDFFGEMALIDDKPRSADAKAHEIDTTVLSIDRATLNEILSMDPHASLQFLNLLCRMISRRLREINDKIIQWKYMSGGF